MIGITSVVEPRCAVRKEFVQVFEDIYREERLLCIQCKSLYQQSGKIVMEDKIILPRRSASPYDEQIMRLDDVPIINAHLISFWNSATNHWGPWKWNSFDIDVNLTDFSLHGPIIKRVFIKPDRESFRVFLGMKPCADGFYAPKYTTRSPRSFSDKDNDEESYDYSEEKRYYDELSEESDYIASCRDDEGHFLEDPF